MRTTKNINKREFINKSFTGICGVIAGAGCSDIFAKETINDNKMINPETSSGLWKWSIEAAFATQTPRGVKCKICPNECTVKLNELSDCRNRINKNNKLYSIGYGNPSAVHIDPIEKKPLYHFLPTTRAYSLAVSGCNLACLNCQNWEISQSSPEETTNYDLMPAKVVEQCIASKCKSIAYTYSEPISFYEYTYDTSKLARAKGIKNVFVSAGYINEEPLRKLCKYLDAANIDLKSFSDNIYEKLNAGKLQSILDALKIFKDENVWLEITNLLVPSWTDDLDMVKKMCDWLYQNDFKDCPLHFSRFHPQFKLTQLPVTPVSILEKARNIAMNAGLRYVYIGNVPGTSAQNTHCPGCKKVVIERKGYRILKNLIENHSCKHCGEKIAGVWK